MPLYIRFFAAYWLVEYIVLYFGISYNDDSVFNSFNILISFMIHSGEFYCSFHKFNSAPIIVDLEIYFAFIVQYSPPHKSVGKPRSIIIFYSASCFFRTPGDLIVESELHILASISFCHSHETEHSRYRNVLIFLSVLLFVFIFQLKPSSWIYLFIILCESTADFDYSCAEFVYGKVNSNWEQCRMTYKSMEYKPRRHEVRSSKCH
jgi:hypothetical protein